MLKEIVSHVMWSNWCKTIIMVRGYIAKLSGQRTDFYPGHCSNDQLQSKFFRKPHFTNKNFAFPFTGNWKAIKGHFDETKQISIIIWFNHSNIMDLGKTTIFIFRIITIMIIISFLHMHCLLHHDFHCLFFPSQD